MFPAHQCLEAKQSARCGIDDGLVVQAQFPAFNGAAQFRLQRKLRQCALVHLAVEQHGLPGSPGFCAIHRRVGIAQQIGGLAAVPRGNDDADAGRHEDFAPFEHDRRLQRGVKALGDTQRIGRLVNVLEQDGELVAPQARDGVPGPHAGVDAPAHLKYELVAQCMAKAVVDRLEAVEIEIENRVVRSMLALPQRQALLETVHEQHAVGHAGQRIVIGMVAQPCFRLVLLDHAAHRMGRSGDEADLVGGLLMMFVQVQVQHAEQPVIVQDRRAVVTVRRHAGNDDLVSRIDTVGEYQFAESRRPAAQAMPQFNRGAGLLDGFGQVVPGHHAQVPGGRISKKDAARTLEGEPRRRQDQFQCKLQPLFERRRAHRGFQQLRQNALDVIVAVDLFHRGLAFTDVAHVGAETGFTGGIHPRNGYLDGKLMAIPVQADQFDALANQCR